MKFFKHCWVFFTHLFGGGPNDPSPAWQQPVLGDSYHLPPARYGPKISERPVEKDLKGPVFEAPNSPEGKAFVCNYTLMGSRYTFCSNETDRGCWLNDKQGTDHYRIDTDYEKRWPTGITRYVTLDITDMTLNADGVPMHNGVVFNRTYPGPWIQACWGDTVVVNVKNRIRKYNGTTIHWHGVRQLNNFQNDGVNAITQCPVPPGKDFTYTFQVTQYGTSWYHSHYSLQYADGLLGPMTFYGPSSANYDFAIDPTLMTDWNHESAFTDIYQMYLGGGPPVMNSILLNGIGNFAGIGSGKKYTISYEKGKRYLMRIINTSVDTSFVFTIDNHILEVISSDFVPISPYNTTGITVGIGQRYHIVVQAHDYPLGHDLAQENFWIRTIAATGCSNFAIGDEPNERQGILRYDKKSTVVPTSRRYLPPGPLNPPPNLNITCRDEPASLLKPVVPWTIGPPANDYKGKDKYEVGLVPNGTDPPPLYSKFVRWAIGEDPMWLDFSDPTVLHTDRPASQFDKKMVVIDESVPKDSWVYMLIIGDGLNITDKTRIFVPVAAHPIHLHGHDFALLQQSESPYQGVDSLHLNTDNPPRRDVVLLPQKGFVVIAFKADNPGAWIIHCHIAWHASSGLALQILERPADIKPPAWGLGWRDQIERGCGEWKDWFKHPKNLWDGDVNNFQDDSGI